MNHRNRFVDKNTMLVRESDRYVLEHLEIAEKIKENALVVMQIVGDDEFNEWARQTAQSMAEKVNPIVYVTVTELKPVRSRIEKLKVEMAGKKFPTPWYVWQMEYTGLLYLMIGLPFIDVMGPHMEK